MSNLPKINWLTAESDAAFVYTLCPEQNINAFSFQVQRGYHHGQRTTDEQRATVARRLIACWNTCDGIPIEQLECDKSVLIDMLKERIELKRKCEELESRLKEIGDFAHDKSTGPAVPDPLWEVRRMAYGE